MPDTSGTVLTSDTLRDVGKKPMVMRSIRVPFKLWEAAKGLADEEEKDISQVVRELLERYVGRRTPPGPEPANDSEE